MISQPPHWERGRIKWDTATVAGATPSTEDDGFWLEGDDPSGVPFVAIADMSRRERVSVTAKSLSVDGLTSRNMPIGQPGTLLFAMYASVGEVAFLDIRATWNQALLGITPDPDKIDSRFLRYVLLDMRDDLLRDVRSNTQSNLNARQVGDIWFQKPPLHEQRSIADYLDRETARIDTLVAEQKRLIEVLAERRQAVIESAVGHGLNPSATMQPSGLFWTAEVPQHWTVTNIRKVATMKTGHTPSRSKPEYWVDCTIPWFTLADVWQLRDGRRTYLGETTNLISEAGLANSSAELLPPGTVVLSRTASVGFSGIMPVNMATSQDFWNWIPSDRLTSEYLMWTFRAMRSEFQSLMIGSTHKTIYQPTAAAFRVPVPPVEEQRRIATYIDEQTRKIDELISESERLIELSRERRSVLITAAVTGQVDVRGQLDG